MFSLADKLPCKLMNFREISLLRSCLFHNSQDLCYNFYYLGLSTRVKTSLLPTINVLANFQSLFQINLTWKCFLNEWKLQGLFSNTMILLYTTSNLIQVIFRVNFSAWISISDFSNVHLKTWTTDSSWFVLCHKKMSIIFFFWKMRVFL